jgi:cellulose synthase/poly-beta-1,6-N-acetylglucosamine synthase-like glycosyltransferase
MVVEYIYILVSLHNRLNYTKNFFNCLSQQSVKKKIRLIVFDDGSTDETKEFLKNNATKIFKILSGDGSFFWSKSTDIGIEYIKTIIRKNDFLLLINNDTKFNKRFVEDLVHESKKNNSIVVANQRKSWDKYEKSGGLYINFKSCSISSTYDSKKINTAIARGTIIPGYVVIGAPRIKYMMFKQKMADIYFFSQLHNKNITIRCSKNIKLTECDNNISRFGNDDRSIIKYLDPRSSFNALNFLYFFMTSGPIRYRFTAIFRLFYYFIKKKFFTIQNANR